MDFSDLKPKNPISDKKSDATDFGGYTTWILGIFVVLAVVSWIMTKISGASGGSGAINEMWNEVLN